MLQMSLTRSQATCSKELKMRYPKPKEGLYLLGDKYASGLKTGKEQPEYSPSVKRPTPKVSTTSKCNSSPLAKDNSR